MGGEAVWEGEGCKVADKQTKMQVLHQQSFSFTFCAIRATYQAQILQTEQCYQRDHLGCDINWLSAQTDDPHGPICLQ